MKTPDPTKAESSAPDTREFSPKSTAMEAQIQKLIGLLAIRSHHTYELRRAGISHPSGRIADLEKRGYSFAVDRITAVDGDGFVHSGVALYTLTDAPAGGPQ
jgi:hypothetical protein